jgi:hypothetical protein
MAESRADKILLNARTTHKERAFRDALKLYSKAAECYMEALTEAGDVRVFFSGFCAAYFGFGGGDG